MTGLPASEFFRFLAARSPQLATTNKQRIYPSATANSNQPGKSAPPSFQIDAFPKACIINMEATN